MDMVFFSVELEELTVPFAGVLGEDLLEAFPDRFGQAPSAILGNENQMVFEIIDAMIKLIQLLCYHSN